uniref:Uncharacterized protein n=1 Tax=Arundo donax TaxID=35708 RepID=A0A0A9EGD1_ARUDO
MDCETIIKSTNRCGYMSWIKPISHRNLMIFGFRTCSIHNRS